MTPFNYDLHAALRDDHGVEVGRYDPRDMSEDGMPTVRSKEELDIFRLYNGSAAKSPLGDDS